MASSYTTNKKIEKPAHNNYVDTWEVPVNGNSGIIDACLGNVTYINMTGRSSYTLTYPDLQASTIVFQNTLNNATVQVLMPTTVSGSFSIVNQTTAAGTSSLLQLAWTSGANTFDINPSETIPMIADGSTNTWFQGGQSFLPGSLSVDISSNVTLTAAQGRYRNINITGAQSGSGELHWNTTAGNIAGGQFTFRKAWTGGGNVLLFPSGVGSTGGSLTASGLWMLVSGVGWAQLV